MEEKKTARAQLMYARIAPRKVQIVCDMIRGKDTKLAEAYMANTPKAGCELMLKLLKSACKNAENNFEMDPDNLYVSEIYADAGPIIKRFRPRAHGRGYRINKRTSHITIVVKDKEEA
jgi:large subunit ribosomal protein L22